MIIEKAKLSEINQIKELLSKTWKATYSQYYSEEVINKITDNWHSIELLSKQATDQDVYFATAKIDSKIVGIITVKKDTSISIFINRLYIDPDYQKRGIGSQLLDSAIKYFPHTKIIKVDCEKQNTNACFFYNKKGFKAKREKRELVEGVMMKTIEYEKQV